MEGVINFAEIDDNIIQKQKPQIVLSMKKVTVYMKESIFSQVVRCKPYAFQ